MTSLYMEADFFSQWKRPLTFKIRVKQVRRNSDSVLKSICVILRVSFAVGLIMSLDQSNVVFPFFDQTKSLKLPQEVADRQLVRVNTFEVS